MSADEMLAKAEKHFAAIRAAIERREVRWLAAPNGVGFQGMCPGYLIVVMRANVEGKGVICDGAITTLGQFHIIHLTPEMARFCFNAATAAHN